MELVTTSSDVVLTISIGVDNRGRPMVISGLLIVISCIELRKIALIYNSSVGYMKPLIKVHKQEIGPFNF